MTLDNVLEEFRRENDAVGLWQVAGRLSEIMPGLSDESLIQQVLELVRNMLAHGFVIGSTPYAAVGFKRWPDQSPSVVLSKIEAEWRARGRGPDLRDQWFLPPAMHN